jgi:hypothetical protein
VRLLVGVVAARIGRRRPVLVGLAPSLFAQLLGLLERLARLPGELFFVFGHETLLPMETNRATEIGAGLRALSRAPKNRL